MARRLARVVLAAALITGVFVALSASASAGEENACKVLKRSEIAKIVGFEAAKGEKTASPGSSQCTWDLTAPGAIQTPQISTNVVTEIAKEYYESERDGATDAVKVKGLGDDAYYNPGFTTVNLLKDDVYLSIQGSFLENAVDPASIQQRLVDLAKKARKRI